MNGLVRNLSQRARDRTDIAFFLPHLEVGGVERVTIDLANGLGARGLNVDVVVAAPNGQMAAGLKPSVHLLNLGVGRTSRSLPGLVRYLRKARPSILVSARVHVNILASAANFMAGKPARHVACEHSFYQMAVKGSLADGTTLRLGALIYRRCDALVAVSDDVASAVARLARIPRERISVISNPVVTESLRARAEEGLHDPWMADGGPLIVAVGRLDPIKRFDRLIGAVAYLRRETPVRLLLIGEGTERGNLETLIHDHGLEACTRLPGVMDNPLPYMRESDVFVLSSDYEAFPTVLVEALYCGANVVATNCCRAVPDLLRHGQLGTIVPPDDERTLASGIAAAIRITRDRQLLRNRAEEFSESAAVDTYCDLFAHICPGFPA